MGLNEMLQWWNLIYLAPLAVSLVWILATVAGGAHSGGHGHDVAHVGHEVSQGIGHAAHEVGHAVHHGDVGHGHDVGHDMGHDHGAHGHDGHDGHHEESTSGRLLTLLGIGRVPITLLIGVYMFCWGVFGMAANQFFGFMKYPAVYIWPSMAVAFVASFTVTRTMAAVVGRYLPSEETYGVSRFELVGSLGKTVFTTDERAGTVDIKDPSGTIHRVQAKTEDGAEPISSGSEVMILDFDEEDKRFVVRISSL